MKKKDLILSLLLISSFPALFDAKDSLNQAAQQKIVEWKQYRWQKGDSPEKLFGDFWIDVLRFNRIDRRHLFPGTKIKIPLNLEEVKNYTPLPAYYEPAKSYEKYILISLADQFLGCYEYGVLKLSFPITSGKPTKGLTPTGRFRVLARHRNHQSSKYRINDNGPFYPMHWGVKFYISRKGNSFWIHGRDLPGFPDSHGCIGLYDEDMQKRYYGYPSEPILDDAKKLYLWLFPDAEDDEKLVEIENGPPIEIVKEIN